MDGNSGQGQKNVAKSLSEWIAEGRNILMQLGLHIKSMISQAQKLTSTTGEAKEITDKISESSTQAIEMIERMENALQSDPPNLVELKECLPELKVHVEKVALDADAALHSFDAVFTASQEMNYHITNTRKTLLKEAEVLQEMGKVAVIEQDMPSAAA